jgi:hypothetical protein
VPEAFSLPIGLVANPVDHSLVHALNGQDRYEAVPQHTVAMQHLPIPVRDNRRLFADVSRFWNRPETAQLAEFCWQNVTANKKGPTALFAVSPRTEGDGDRT